MALKIHDETDKLSYHVSAELRRAPLPNAVTDWPDLLNQFDAREILHVTFGSVLTDKLPNGQARFRDGIMDFLRTHSEAYAGNLERHFARHLKLFVA